LERLETGLRENDVASSQAGREVASAKLDALMPNQGILPKPLEMTDDVSRDRESKIIALRFAEAELAREERLLESISSRKLALQTEMRAPARVSVRQKASVPKAPIHRGNSSWQLSICVVVLVLPLLVVIATGTRDR
jgi:hypothetical protein